MGGFFFDTDVFLFIFFHMKVSERSNVKKNMSSRELISVSIYYFKKYITYIIYPYL